MGNLVKCLKKCFEPPPRKPSAKSSVYDIESPRISIQKNFRRDVVIRKEIPLQLFAPLSEVSTNEISFARQMKEPLLPRSVNDLDARLTLATPERPKMSFRRNQKPSMISQSRKSSVPTEFYSADEEADIMNEDMLDFPLPSNRTDQPSMDSNQSQDLTGQLVDPLKMRMASNQKIMNKSGIQSTNDTHLMSDSLVDLLQGIRSLNDSVTASNNLPQRGFNDPLNANRNNLNDKINDVEKDHILPDIPRMIAGLNGKDFCLELDPVNADELKIFKTELKKVVQEKFDSLPGNYQLLFSDEKIKFAPKIYYQMGDTEASKNVIRVYLEFYIPCASGKYIDFLNDCQKQKIADANLKDYFQVKQLDSETVVKYFKYKRMLSSSPKDFLMVASSQRLSYDFLSKIYSWLYCATSVEMTAGFNMNCLLYTSPSPRDQA
eukprot:TRINITY_DN27861_c0_g1_i1.p1 TRINITY_DN27861_c0_g1~~TRINITY_DN27861_c0_g1_i1.p1  ORF type:complete len:434 (+),score=80.34 TRINITY_DN27861_c0_g1_i1:85-1386(+)